MLERHLQALEARIPELGQQLLDATEQRLRETYQKQADDAARQALNSWRSKAALIEGPLQRGLRTAVRPLPTPTLQQRPVLEDIDQLTLVDEDQADQAIEISRVIQQIDARAEWELRELGALCSKLPGDGRLDTAAFAKALCESVQALELGKPARSHCLNAAGSALAEALRDLAHQASQRLRGWGLEPSGFASIATDERVIEALDVSRAGALLDLRERVHASAPEPAAHSDQDQTAELLSQLFQQIQADPDLDPPYKQAICNLQTSVLQLAVSDPAVLGSDQHPTWALINQIASHAGDHPLASDPRGLEFLAFVEALVARLGENASSTAFGSALGEVRAFIHREQEDELEASVFARLALSKQERHDELLPLMRQQVLEQAQLSRYLGPVLFEFLLGAWSEALTQAMLDQGAEGPLTQRLMAGVEDLLSSLEPTRDDVARTALRQRLPALIQLLQQGMDLVRLPAADRDAVMDELMAIHRERTRLAAPATAPAPPPAAPAKPEPQARPAPPTPSLKPVHELNEDQLQHELLPPETDADNWGADTSIAALPTVHMGLDDETGPLVVADAWVERLQPGARCKLFLQGHWTSAHLLWRSDNGSFFMFSSQLKGGRHSMTRRALQRLRAEGLATEVAETSLMQRAVTGMLHKMAR
ncbi:DUF1631 family protein [Pelomonas sp. SE-A7]|uniref:DUF1631 family protein n=1 Tax=Pelomonas sp. SE-A7 TaxID=3054953 RepID=UPI00259CEC33|nr:DUF1631 family protein [Pelomonas sp. SE-A7]MDM4765559.1 DUF1631 family protein [Pelomonas sp. SE-A7]